MLTYNVGIYKLPLWPLEMQLTCTVKPGEWFSTPWSRHLLAAQTNCSLSPTASADYIGFGSHRSLHTAWKNVTRGCQMFSLDCFAGIWLEIQRSTILYNLCQILHGCKFKFSSKYARKALFNCIIELLDEYFFWFVCLFPIKIKLGIKGSVIWVKELVEFSVLRSHLLTLSFLAQNSEEK